MLGAWLELAGSDPRISGVTDGRVRGAVFLAVRVKVRPGRGAPVGVVAKLVDVEAVVSGLQPGDLARYLHGVGIGLHNG